MIKTDPSPEFLMKYYQQYNKKVLEMRDIITKLVDTNNFTLKLPNILDAVFLFLSVHSKMSLAESNIIKEITNIIDSSANKEEMQEKIKGIEKRVQDTLVPLDELIKKSNQIHEVNNSDYIQ